MILALSILAAFANAQNCQIPDSGTYPDGYAWDAQDSSLPITNCNSTVCDNPTYMGTISCVAPYVEVSTPLPTGCAANNPKAVSFTGCEEPLQCVQPAPMTGYKDMVEGANIVDCFSTDCGSGDVTSITCDTDSGYDGAVQVAACNSPDDEAIISGCDFVCKVPDTVPYGYVATPNALITSCTATDCSSPDMTGIHCDYAVTAAGSSVDITVCTAPDDDVSFSGCPVQCVYPEDSVVQQSGIDGITADADVASCTVESCTVDTSGMSCGSDYTLAAGAAIEVSQCSWQSDGTGDRIVGLSGCVVQCKTPGTIPAEYSGIDVDAQLMGCTAADCSAPANGGFQCADGYTGSVQVTGCAGWTSDGSGGSTLNTEVTLSGCTATTTTTTTTAAPTTTLADSGSRMFTLFVALLIGLAIF